MSFTTEYILGQEDDSLKYSGLEDGKTSFEGRMLPVISLDDIEPSPVTAEKIAAQIVDIVLGGYINPLDLPVKRKCIEQAFELALKNEDVKSAIISELKKFPKEKADHLGAKVEVMEAGTIYHFDNCNDPILAELEAQQKGINEAVKNRKELLKRVDKEGEVIVVKSTGETATVYPPFKTSTTTVKVTMK